MHSTNNYPVDDSNPYGQSTKVYKREIRSGVSEEQRSRLIAKARAVLRKAVFSDKPEVSEFSWAHDEAAHSGEVIITDSNDASGETILSLRISHADDGDGDLTVFKSPYQATSKNKPNTVVSLSPAGEIVAELRTDSVSPPSVIPLDEALLFVDSTLEAIATQA